MSDRREGTRGRDGAHSGPDLRKSDVREPLQRVVTATTPVLRPPARCESPLRSVEAPDPPHARHTGVLPLRRDEIAEGDVQGVPCFTKSRVPRSPNLM